MQRQKQNCSTNAEPTKNKKIIAFCSPNSQIHTSEDSVVQWVGVHFMQRQACFPQMCKAKQELCKAFCSPDSKTIRSCINHTFICTYFTELTSEDPVVWWVCPCHAKTSMCRQTCTAYGTPCNVLLSTDYLQFLEVKKFHFPAHF